MRHRITFTRCGMLRFFVVLRDAVRRRNEIQRIGL